MNRNHVAAVADAHARGRDTSADREAADKFHRDCTERLATTHGLGFPDRASFEGALAELVPGYAEADTIGECWAILADADAAAVADRIAAEVSA